jgi:uncharacterized protein YjiS (DUF1127 family)
MAGAATAAWPARRGGGGWARRRLAQLRRWRARALERRLLRGFDAPMLRDLGICPGEARTEADKPFWRD